MIVWLCLRWWYGAGWLWAWRRGISDRVRWCMDMFSISTLATSLFAPFKQTFTGRVKGSLGDHFRAFIDKTISRVIGFTIRMTLIVTGLFFALFAFLSGIVFIGLWAAIPLLPLIGIVLFISGGGQ